MRLPSGCYTKGHLVLCEMAGCWKGSPCFAIYSLRGFDTVNGYGLEAGEGHQYQQLRGACTRPDGICWSGESALFVKGQDLTPFWALATPKDSSLSVRNTEITRTLTRKCLLAGVLQDAPLHVYPPHPLQHLARIQAKGTSWPLQAHHILLYSRLHLCQVIPNETLTPDLGSR